MVNFINLREEHGLLMKFSGSEVRRLERKGVMKLDNGLSKLVGSKMFIFILRRGVNKGAQKLHHRFKTVQVSRT